MWAHTVRSCSSDLIAPMRPAATLTRAIHFPGQNRGGKPQILDDELRHGRKAAVVFRCGDHHAVGLLDLRPKDARRPRSEVGRGKVNDSSRASKTTGARLRCVSSSFTTPSARAVKIVGAIGRGYRDDLRHGGFFLRCETTGY